MKSTGNKTPEGAVPRAGTNTFARILLKRGKSNGIPKTAAAAMEGVDSKRERARQVMRLAMRVAPLRAAQGDDDLMSQPPEAIGARRPV